MIKRTNCEVCLACCRALPKVFTDNYFGGINIDQKEGQKYSKEKIEACCPHNYLKMEEE